MFFCFFFFFGFVRVTPLPFSLRFRSLASSLPSVRTSTKGTLIVVVVFAVCLSPFGATHGYSDHFNSSSPFAPCRLASRLRPDTAPPTPPRSLCYIFFSYFLVYLFLLVATFLFSSLGATVLFPLLFGGASFFHPAGHLPLSLWRSFCVGGLSVFFFFVFWFGSFLRLVWPTWGGYLIHPHLSPYPPLPCAFLPLCVGCACCGPVEPTGSCAMFRPCSSWQLKFSGQL